MKISNEIRIGRRDIGGNGNQFYFALVPNDPKFIGAADESFKAIKKIRDNKHKKIMKDYKGNSYIEYVFRIGKSSRYGYANKRVNAFAESVSEKTGLEVDWT